MPAVPVIEPLLLIFHVTEDWEYPDGTERVSDPVRAKMWFSVTDGFVEFVPAAQPQTTSVELDGVIVTFPVEGILNDTLLT